MEFEEENATETKTQERLNFFIFIIFQYVYVFVSAREQIWRNVALRHLLTNGSSAVNGCRQNESPNSW